jgi:flavin-dependent dehydrogenase
VDDPVFPPTAANTNPLLDPDNPTKIFTPYSAEIGPLDEARVNGMCLVEYPEWQTGGKPVFRDTVREDPKSAAIFQTALQSVVQWDRIGVVLQGTAITSGHYPADFFLEAESRLPTEGQSVNVVAKWPFNAEPACGAGLRSGRAEGCPTTPACEGPARECDVLVIGGGPAGLAAAIDLRVSSGLDVVVAEARGEPSERFGESLPPDILVLLDRLGLSAAFRSDGHLPCPGSVSVWGRAKPGHNDFILNPIGPAWHIDRARFEAMLRGRAVKTGAAIWTRTRAVSAQRVAGGFDVAVEHERGAPARARGTAGRRIVHTGWVLDATGGRGWFARGQGARRLAHDRMVAIVRAARISGGTFTSQTVVEATRDGWWYCARLPCDRIVTVLVTDTAQARSLTQRGFAGWRERLASTSLVGPRLGSCRLADERLRPYPVVSARLDRVAGDRWLAVGDAASAWDPILSQGVYKALLDAADATRTIGAAVGRSAPPPWRYADRVVGRFADYCANRADLYGIEQRWSDARFWDNRASVQRSPTAGVVGRARTRVGARPVSRPTRIPTAGPRPPHPGSERRRGRAGQRRGARQSTALAGVATWRQPESGIDRARSAAISASPRRVWASRRLRSLLSALCSI